MPVPFATCGLLPESPVALEIVSPQKKVKETENKYPEAFGAGTQQFPTPVKSPLAEVATQ